MNIFIVGRKLKLNYFLLCIGGWLIIKYMVDDTDFRIPVRSLIIFVSACVDLLFMMHNIIVSIFGISLLLWGTRAAGIHRSVETELDIPATEDAAAAAPTEIDDGGNVAPLIGKRWWGKRGLIARGTEDNTASVIAKRFPWDKRGLIARGTEGNTASVIGKPSPTVTYKKRGFPGGW